MKPWQSHKPNSRKKPYRAYGRIRYPLAHAMARMGMLALWGTLHPTKGYRPNNQYLSKLRSGAFADIT